MLSNMSGWCTQDKIWRDITIENNIYMINVTKHNDELRIFLTNLIELWVETLTSAVILQKCRELNPLLSVDLIDCNEIIRNMLTDIPKHAVEKSVQQIKLHATIEGGKLKFDLNLSKGSSQLFWEVITKPLSLSSMELMRQHKILLDLIHRKDEEIAEYKAEGAELIRKNIETKIFTKDQFEIDLTAPKPQDFTNTFQAMVQFYNTLVLHKTHVKDEDGTCPRLSRCTNWQKEDANETKEVESIMDNSNESKILPNDIPTSSGIGNTSIGRKVKKRNTIGNKVSQNKIKITTIMNIPMTPRKRLKKTLSDYIL